MISFNLIYDRKCGTEVPPPLPNKGVLLLYLCSLLRLDHFHPFLFFRLVENIEKFTNQITIEKGESSRVFTHPKLAVAVATVKEENKGGLFFGLTEEEHDGRPDSPSSQPPGLTGAQVL